MFVLVCNGTETKKGGSSAEPNTPEFLLAHDPQREAEGWDATELNPDLQPPQNDLQRTKREKNREGTEKPDETPAKPNHTKSQNLLHTSGVDLDESFTLNTIGKEEGTSNF